MVDSCTCSSKKARTDEGECRSCHSTCPPQLHLQGGLLAAVVAMVSIISLVMAIGTLDSFTPGWIDDKLNNKLDIGHERNNCVGLIKLRVLLKSLVLKDIKMLINLTNF